MFALVSTLLRILRDSINIELNYYPQVLYFMANNSSGNIIICPGLRFAMRLHVCQLQTADSKFAVCGINLPMPFYRLLTQRHKCLTYKYPISAAHKRILWDVWRTESIFAAALVNRFVQIYQWRLMFSLAAWNRNHSQQFWICVFSMYLWMCIIHG
jgi:hypothetical protein